MTKFSGAKIVVLTGAGISSESGLKTFRDADGLWEGNRIEDVATPEAFARQPELVHRFYNLRRQQLKTVEPNGAHLALAEFEKHHQGSFLLVTQNVDDLHERAGSKNVLHMHGELCKARCLDTGEIFSWDEDLTLSTVHPRGGNSGRLRPHICWFGEMPFFMDEIMEELSQADIFVAIGTSGLVYPAAGFVSMVPSSCRRVLLNKDDASNCSFFGEFHSGPATQTVSEFFLKG
ncbi:MAG TPA: NAD-dependent deacylase [Bdellovibrionota bacterium]